MNYVPGSVFALLHPKVRQSVCKLGWTGLYPIQEQAIPLIIEHANDLIVCAPTSGGKTEAVFLPILSNLLESSAPSFQAMCISPLKALINDQFRRLSILTRSIGISVSRWHGDVDQQRKRALRFRPKGILLITPESLESNFINFSHLVPQLYRGLQYVIIDELHAFLGNERGIHLLSLLARLFEALGHRPRCFGLSATLGDPESARAFINAEAPTSVQLIEDDSTKRRIVVHLKTCVQNAQPPSASRGRSGDEAVVPDNACVSEEDPKDVEGPDRSGDDGVVSDALAQVAADIQTEFRNSTNLVFANSRRTVEVLADSLRNNSREPDQPEPALVLHHGSLSRQVRHHTESALKSGRPTNALCTSSLELGIDIGAIEAVGQIDPPCTVSALVQRVGRSGRGTGRASVLRFYVRSAVPQLDSNIDELLFPKLLQAVAMTKLLLSGWLEPIQWARMHLSTLVHQVLSKLKENGGVMAVELYRSLCQRGAFRRITPDDFAVLLKSLCEHGLVDQEPEGAIILGIIGEKVTSAPNFYAAFVTPLELSVRYGRTQIGKLAVTIEVKPGQCLLLNGKRWLIEQLDWKAKSLWVRPTAVKKPTVFLGHGGDVHPRIFVEMHRVLCGSDAPSWLDPWGRQQLISARQTATRVGLTESNVLERDDQIQWFPWTGTRAVTTLCLWAERQGISCTRGALSLTYESISAALFRQHLEELIKGKVAPVELSKLLQCKRYEKFDPYLTEDLLDKANANDRLDLDGAKRAVRHTLTELPPLSC